MLKNADKQNLTSFADIYRRIQMATKTRTQGELAKILEVCQSSIADSKRRNTIPPSWYVNLFDKFGLSQDWLRYGAGPMFLRTEQGYVQQASPVAAQAAPAHDSDPTAECRLATVYSMLCEPDGGGSMPALKAVGKLALPASFAGADVLVLRMHANNMAPTLRRDAYIGVDAGDVQPLSGGIFVLKGELEGLLVRRVFLDCGTRCSYRLRSDDASYPESRMSAEDLAARIMGRVSWVMQNLSC